MTDHFAIQMPSLIPQQQLAAPNNPMSNNQALFGLNNSFASIQKPELIPQQQLSASAPAGQQKFTNDNSPLYLKGVPMPLSQNNPFLAYFPKKGSMMVPTARLISEAMNWENGESARNVVLNQAVQAQQQTGIDRAKRQEIVAKALYDASTHPDVMGGEGNRDKMDYYNSVVPLINLPGGENVASSLIGDIGGLYGASKKQPKEMTPLDQARIDEINSQISLNNKRAALLGLNGGASGSKGKSNPQLDVYNDVYGLLENYKSPADFLADVRRNRETLSSKMGAKNYEALLNSINNYSKTNMNLDTAGNILPGAAFKPGTESPMRAYLEGRIPQQRTTQTAETVAQKNELASINKQYGTNIPSYAAAAELLKEAQSSGVGFSVLAKKKYPKKQV
jgi:hypothetical protein